MKKATLLSLILISFFLSASSQENDQSLLKGGATIASEMDTFLALGQSNMAGRAPIEPSVTGALEHVKLLSNNIWVDASNPMNIYSTIRKDVSMQQVGPSYSFAKAMARHTGKLIGMVVNARGGTAIEEFSKGGTYYDANIARIVEAKAFGTIKGIIWHQGESNSKDAAYLTKLNAMVTDYRAAIEDSVFFVASQLGGWNAQGGTTPKYGVFNGLIPKIADAVENSDYVVNTGLTHIGDFTHFNLPSQILLGQRYAQKMLAELYDTDITIIDINLSGNGFLTIPGEEENITETNDFSYTFEKGSNVELSIEAGEGKLFTSLLINGTDIPAAGGQSSYVHSFSATNDNILTITMETELDESLGIRSNNHSMNIYPNPAQTQLCIGNSSNIRIQNIEILNVLGNTVYEDSSGQLTIEVGSYTKGLYILAINNTYKLPFIKD